MTLNIDLDSETQLRLEATAKLQGLTLEEYARRRLTESLVEPPVGSASRAWELGKHLFGSFSSGRSDLSQNHETILGEIFDAKRKERAERRAD